MNLQALRSRLPDIEFWIEATLAAHRPQASTALSFGFSRLEAYFSREVLVAAQAISIDQVPTPPFAALGLGALSDFESIKPDGITYLDSYFIRSPFVANESVHFHELVHVAQWRYLGPDRFLLAYAVGHLQNGYRDNPFEVMAYTLQAAFDRQGSPFDVVARVESELDDIYSALLGDAE